jgi:hypothetical protein
VTRDSLTFDGRGCKLCHPDPVPPTPRQQRKADVARWMDLHRELAQLAKRLELVRGVDDE